MEQNMLIAKTTTIDSQVNWWPQIASNFGDQLFFCMENLHTRFIMLLNMLISKKATEKFSGQVVTSEYRVILRYNSFLIWKNYIQGL